ncbi:P-loop NTPase family protein [Rickettsiales endosymbiont of Stachyamoeba lipophora]|uniref:DnaA ATPase domain-containing protein n=1 Tax=Rickettsiales endosymbiont of Stachyamoeba lipophora TaxID=2486578 RepID=UPI000F6472EB|nr:DnaA/Hda family protein [Rickettsiales endosymbiont of Stachyamoeba lipophora]AZL16187.1 hypothetical protein EF513_06555 [Rickettsiales endosymbiont of Stachyamoeba lipophora]
MTEQIILPFSNFTEESNLILRSDCNRAALKFLEAWPRNLNYIRVAILYGEKSAGKTTLLKYWLKCNSGLMIDSLKEFLLNSESYIDSYNCFALDNLIQSKFNQQHLFHLLNVCQNKTLLITTDSIDFNSIFVLPDLISRLKSYPVIPIEKLDEMMARQLVIKTFSQQQLSIDVKVVDYIIENLELNYQNISNLIDKLDKHSSLHKKKISLSLVKKFIP